MLHQPPTEYRHFSAEVRMELRVDDRVFDVWSIGPSEIILFNGEDIRKGDAEIFLCVDGTKFRWPIRLPNGAVPFDPEVYMVPRGPMEPVNPVG